MLGVAALGALFLWGYLRLVRRLKITERTAGQLRSELRAREIIEEAEESKPTERPNLVLIRGWRATIVAPVLWLVERARAHPMAATTAGAASLAVVTSVIIGPPSNEEASSKLPGNSTRDRAISSQQETGPQYQDIEVRLIPSEDEPTDESADQQEDRSATSPQPPVGDDQPAESVPPANTTPVPAGSSIQDTGSEGSGGGSEPPADDEGTRPPDTDPEPPETPADDPPGTDCLVEAGVSTPSLDLDLCVEVDLPEVPVP